MTIFYPTLANLVARSSVVASPLEHQMPNDLLNAGNAAPADICVHNL
jgi:hypothetical protein